MSGQYVAKNTIVCVSGKISNSQAIKKVKEYFGKTKRADFSKKPKLIEVQSKPEILLDHRKTDQTHMVIGVRGFNIFDPKKYVQKLLAVVLGGMMSSRLFVKIREKMGAAYYIHASSNTDTDAGYLAVSAGVDTKKVESVIIAVLEEFKKTTKTKIPFSELKKAKDYIRGKTALLLEPSDAKASFYANQELLENKILELNEILKKIDKITSNDILKLAKTIFVPERLNLAATGPIKDDKKLYNIIKDKL
jgi:predicted Zn-dependent peptidase